MVSVSFTISDELRAKMEKFPWINWSGIAREDAIRQEEKTRLFDELEELTKDSTLTDEDCLKLGRLVKEKIWQRLQKED